MNSDFTLHETEAKISSLCERVSQLEEENSQLQRVLERNSRMFTALIGNGDDGIALTGPNRRIVRVIKGLTGIDPAALTGVLIDSLAVPEDRQIIVDAYRQLLQGVCSKITIAVRVPRPDGALALHKAILTDMLDNPDVHGIVWNYSAEPYEAPRTVPTERAEGNHIVFPAAAAPADLSKTGRSSA